MIDSLHLKIITPAEVIFNEECLQINLPGMEGRFVILVNHMNLISLLKPGLLEVKTIKNQILQFFITSGVAEIENNQCTLLVEHAIDRSKIEVNKLKDELIEHQRLLNLENSNEFKNNTLVKMIEFKELILRS